MFKRIFTHFLIKLILASSLLAFAFEASSTDAKFVSIPIAAQEPKIDAKAWALMELNSRWIVAHNNALEKRAPASITKLMANYVLFSELNAGRIDLKDKVVISERAWRAIGSRTFAEVGSQIELEVLLKGMVIQSGNDASIALAEHVSGTEQDFAALMNKYARELGLENSFFVNATGLTESNQEMTPVDILKLSAALINDFPEYYRWYAQKEFTYNGIRQRNRNGLLWKDESVDGLKTGYTDAAGYCLVATADRNGQRWIAVVLGTNSAREREAAAFKLLEYGYSNFEPLTLLDEQESHGQIEVYSGDSETLQLKVEEPAKILVPIGRKADLKTSYSYPSYLVAPIATSQPVGKVALEMDGIELYTTPLLAMSNIQEAGFFGRFLDSIRLRLRQFQEG
ncbi:MAG: D-alanyl-D-alanine carboxypeptidase [Gammaproteobacteria bacterium]|nr:D-alanyl-D-alanine carboxypeptidase [Gammaproteobacteria bacterium]